MDNYNYSHDDLANEELVNQLRMFKEYLLNDDAPEWQQLIAIAGFVIDTVNTLDCKQKSDIYDEIVNAVNYELEKPYYKKLISMWDDLNYNITGKYAYVKTMQEKFDIISDFVEMKYPGLVELEKKYLKID